MKEILEDLSFSLRIIAHRSSFSNVQCSTHSSQCIPKTSQGQSKTTRCISFHHTDRKNHPFSKCFDLRESRSSHTLCRKKNLVPSFLIATICLLCPISPLSSTAVRASLLFITKDGICTRKSSTHRPQQLRDDVVLIFSRQDKKKCLRS